MGRNDGPHIGCASVAQIQGIPVVEFVYGLIGGEAAIYKFEEFFTNLLILVVKELIPLAISCSTFLIHLFSAPELQLQGRLYAVFISGEALEFFM